MTLDFIPVSMPDLNGNEEKYVLEAVRSTWISSTGAFVDRFERDFSTLCGVDYAIPVSNGTAALHLTMLALGIGPGDEVIVPSLSYVATANAVKYVGAAPVFIDVDEHTWCIDPVRLEDAITPRTRAIIVVHLYGHPADMDSIKRVALPYGITVLEDAAEALLARYKGTVVGGLAKLAAFSFYGNKVITSGEGGAVTTNDPELAYRVRILRGQGMDPERRYFFPVTGYNYRLTNLSCAILCAQIERVEYLVKRRREIFNTYNELLAGIPGIDFQPVAPWAEISPWLYCITVDAKYYGHAREELAGHLAQNGVETRPFFIPLHTLPPFRSSSNMNFELPVTDRLALQGINLPTFPTIETRHIEKITGLIRSLAKT